MQARARIDGIEALINQDVGRHTAPLFAASRGGLWGAASALAASPPLRVGLLTGFYVPLGRPPAAETDGPAGAALLARFLSQVGAACRLLTDAPCASACRVSLDAAGLDAVPLDVAAIGGHRADCTANCTPDPAADVTATWRRHGVTWAIAIERCGTTAEGRPRNMRGQDLSSFTAPLDAVFSAGPWRTIGIADGGNELGMGSLPPGLVAAHVPFGAAIACVTPADHLVMAGVSHWGAYALIAALGVIREDWRRAALDSLDAATDRTIVEALVARGPAVDGVTLGQTATIDGLDMATHGRKLAAVRAVLEQHGFA